MKRSTIIDVIAYLLILLFVYTASSKLLLFDTFHAQLNRQPIAKSLIPLLWIGIPLTEIVTAVCLLMPSWRRMGLFLSFLLMTGFTLYVAYMLTFVPHNNLPCTCGGIIKQLNWKEHLVFNMFFTVCAFVGIYLDKKEGNVNHQKTQLI